MFISSFFVAFLLANLAAGENVASTAAVVKAEAAAAGNTEKSPPAEAKSGRSVRTVADGKSYVRTQSGDSSRALAHGDLSRKHPSSGIQLTKLPQQTIYYHGPVGRGKTQSQRFREFAMKNSHLVKSAGGGYGGPTLYPQQSHGYQNQLITGGRPTQMYEQTGSETQTGYPSNPLGGNQMQTGYPQSGYQTGYPSQTQTTQTGGYPQTPGNFQLQNGNYFGKPENGDTESNLSQQNGNESQSKYPVNGHLPNGQLQTGHPGTDQSQTAYPQRPGNAYPQQQGNGQTQTGYPQRPGGGQTQTGYPQESNGSQMQGGYPQRPGNAQVKPSYPQQQGGNQGGYPKPGLPQQQTGSQMQSGFPQRPGYGQTQSGYPQQVISQTGYPQRPDYGQSQVGSSQQPDGNQIQGGYPKPGVTQQQSGSQAQGGYPQRPGSGQTQTGYPQQQVGNQVQGGYPKPGVTQQQGGSQAQGGYPQRPGSGQTQTGYPQQQGGNQVQGGYPKPGFPQQQGGSQTVNPQGSQSQTEYPSPIGSYPQRPGAGQYPSSGGTETEGSNGLTESGNENEDFGNELGSGGSIPGGSHGVEGTGVTSNEKLRQYCKAPRGQFASESCNKFVNCWDDVVVEQECGGDLVFNEEKSYCDYPENVDCGGRVTSKPEAGSEGDDNCPSPFATYRSEHDCGEFIVCAHGIAYKFHCPSELAYNDSIGVCDYSQNVDCMGVPLLPYPEGSESETGEEMEENTNETDDYSNNEMNEPSETPVPAWNYRQGKRRKTPARK